MSALVLESPRLFDGQTLHRDMRVVVEDGRVARVEPLAGTTPPGGEVETLRGAFLMPGLIDSHLHIAGYVEGSPAGVPFKPVKDFLRLLVLNGITTVRDTGNSIETIQYVREWGERYAGPRVFASGPLLDVPPLVWPFSRIVREPAVARRQVELLHLEGMDFVKSYRNVGPEVLAAIVETARGFGMDVAADVHGVSALEACRLGVRSLEHAFNLFDGRALGLPDDEAFRGAQGRARVWHHFDPASEKAEEMIAALLEQGTYVCPTLLVSHRWCDLDAMVHEPYLDYMVAVMPYHQYFKRMQGAFGMAIGRRIMKDYLPVPRPSRSEKAEIDDGLAKVRAFVAMLHCHGVPLVAGTDSPNPSIVPGFSLHQEMALMVEAGLSPLDVLAAATSRAAALLRRDDLGGVRPGCHADLLLLDADPTEDIRHSRRIRAVVKAGRPIDLDHVHAKFQESLKQTR